MPDASAVFAIFLHIVAMGSSYYTRPDEAKYRKSYVSESECIKASKPLDRSVRGKSVGGIAEIKGAVCQKSEVVK